MSKLLITILLCIAISADFFGQAITVNGVSLFESSGSPSNCSPGGYKTINAASTNGTCLDLASAAFNAGAVWVCDGIDLNQTFKVSFTANFGSNQATGDGIAFLLQREALPQVIGGRGGGMGYAVGDGAGCQSAPCPIDPSVAVEFDTYNGSSFGDNDLPCNHMSIQIDGSTAAAATIEGPNCLLPGGVSVVDGLDHDICITWDPGVLEYNVYFDGAQIGSFGGDIRTYFPNPTDVWWGFTAATGGAAQDQSVCNVVMETNIMSPSCICNPTISVATNSFPSSCNGTDGSFLIGSLEPNTIYNFSYDLDGFTVGPFTITTNAFGNYLLSGLGAGTYTNFTADLLGCVVVSSGPLLLIEPDPPILVITDPPARCEPGSIDLTDASITDGSSGGGILTYWVDAAATSPLSNPSSVTTSGTYYIQADNGCTDIQPVNVIVNPAPMVNSPLPWEAIICSGGSFSFTPSADIPGTTFSWFTTPSSPNLSGFSPNGNGSINESSSNSGNTTETITYTISPSGPAPSFCAGSSFDFVVTVFPAPAPGTESYVGCAGDGYSVVVNGVTYDESNPSGTQVLSNANGCDSTVTIDLTFNSSVTGSESYVGCNGDGYSVVVNGVTYDEGNPSGIETLTAVAGCDSIVTINLVYNNNTIGTESYVGCAGDGYSVVVNGVTYDESNPSGTQVLSNTNGCDSTVTIDLVYNSNTTGTENYVGCAGDGYSVVVNGVTYDESNPSGTQVLSNANGCDSTVTIDLVYNNNTTGTENYVGCAGDGYSVVVNGVTYDESNPSGTQVLSNANGCDSTVTIDLVYNSNTTGTENYVGCAGDGYSVVVNGVTYDESNPSGTQVLSNANGCDSTVTIDLVYNSNTTGTENYVGCAGDGYSVVVNGVTYDESNPSGTQVLSNANGCDSTVTIDLVYNNNTTGTESYVGCAGDGYSVVVNGVTYDESNPSGTQVLSNANGCDSTVTIDLTFNSSVTGSESYVGCNGDGYSVVVNGVTYDESNPSGIQVLSNTNGCDSTVTIDLVYNSNTTGTENYVGCAGDGYSVVVNGVTYDESNQSGIQVLSNANGCDSTVTIYLVYNSNTTGTENYVGCAGDGYSVVVNGVTYDESNPSGTQVLSNANGCDSTVTIDLVYNNNTTGTENYVGCAGDGYSVVVNGVTYDESNPSGTQVLSNANGCDSTVTIDLTFNSSVTGSESYVGCNGDGYSVVVNGVTYDEGNPSGTETLTAVAGCDSIVTIDLVYNNNTIGTESYVGCAGDGYSVVVNGVTYDESNPSGTQVLSNANGCDSTVTIDLTFNSSVTGSESYVGCNGDGYSVVVNGVTYDEGNPSGTETLTAVVGCDSIVTIDLVYNNNTIGTESYVGCAGDGYSVVVNGVTYDESNPSGTQVLSNANGCDSTVTIDLTFNSSVTGSESYVGCNGDGYSVVVNGVTYDESNPSGTQVLSNANGCDSTVTIDLTFNSSVTGSESYVGCNGDGYSVVVNGVTYDEGNPSGIETLTAVAGCDSIVTIDLVYNNNTTGTESYVGCAGDGYSVVVNGVTYDESNPSGIQVLSNTNGCDSTVTIDLVYNSNTTGTENYVGCAGDGYSVVVNGVTYDESNPSGTQVLSNANGCDSTVTIDLVYNNNTTGTENYVGCAGDGYSVVVNGVTYDESNPSGTQVLSNANGCDSTVTIDLVYNSNTTGTENYVGCAGDGYSVVVNGVTYDESNPSGTQVLSNANGCDSTVTIDLIFLALPSFTVSGTDPSVCNDNDGSITISGLNPSTDYTLGYDSLSVASQITTITTDASGEYVISGLLAGLYTDFNIELNGCSFTLNQTVDLNNPGAPSIDALSSTTECDTYTLPAITGTNLSGNQSYYTQSNGAGTPLSEGDVISSTQTIYIYDILGTCADESNFTITIDYTPSLINPGPQEACESFNLPLSIDGTNLSGNENYYSDLQSNGGTVITDAITGSQTVYIYDANGNCSNEISFEVTVNPLPSLVSFTGEGTYCEGEDVNNLIVEVSGAPDYTLDYTLNGNPTTISSSNSTIDLGNASGTYVLTALADNACGISLDQTQTIIVNPLPSIPTVSEDASYCSNTVAEDLQASGSAENYSWYSDASLSELIGSNQSYSPDMIMGTTTYYVTATENGCEGSPAEVSITFENCEIIIPTAFTPDDDQVNDTWNLGDIDVIYPNNVVSVYNRWGNKIYESDQGAYSQRPWNGTFNEQALPVASYYFIIEFNDNSTQNKTGIVSLIK